MLRVVLAFMAFACLTASPAAAAGDQLVDDQAFVQHLQWGLEKIGAPEAWSVATGDGETIAIIDSGIDVEHEDLRSKIVRSISCVESNGDPDECHGKGVDDHGHGTHVAGIAAAITNNRVGVASVVPGADLMSVKVLQKTCGLTEPCDATGTSDDVSAGVRWAADHGADVINLSLGNKTSAVLGPDFTDALRYAWSKGAVPVVAAGNEFVLSPLFSDVPAILVSATTRDDEQASYSNGVGDAMWAMAAPGGDGADTSKTCRTGGRPSGILSTYWQEGETNQYACLAGTSMAAPHVAGAVAVMLSLGLKPQLAVDRLLATAVDLGDEGPDPVFGSGRLDLGAAVEGTVHPVSTTVPRSPATTHKGSSVPGAVTTSLVSPSATTEVTEPGGALVDPGQIPGEPAATGGVTANLPESGDDDRPMGLVVLAMGLIAGTTVAGTVALRRGAVHL